MNRAAACLSLFVVCFQIGYSADSLERTYLRLTVTLSDSEGDRLAAGLTRNDFQISDRGKSQFIEYFSATPSPSSVTILLDMDGSMQSINLDDSLKKLVEIGNIQSVPDEVSIIGFSEKSTVIKNFDWQVKNINFDEILKLLEPRRGYGQAGLAEALSLAAERVRARAKNYNRSIVLITDAEEDLSLSTTQQIQNQIETMGVRVYGIFFPGEKRLDHGRLHDLAVKSGGRYFRISEPSPLELIMRWIMHELRHQYVIGFTPMDEANRISVRLSSAQLIPGISFRYTSTKKIGRIQ
jgi:VWFA-related protein